MRHKTLSNSPSIDPRYDSYDVKEAKVESYYIPKYCQSDVSLDTGTPFMSQLLETGALPTSQILRTDLSEDYAGDG